MKRTAIGKNHKDEEILKIYLERCPICYKPMIHMEFLFNLAPTQTGTDMDKLMQIQQIETMIDKVKNNDKIEFNSFLMGCQEHYLHTPKDIMARRQLKPYVYLDSEDVFLLNQYPINKVYMIQSLIN